MNNSEFDTLGNTLLDITDVIPLETDGATSDTYKVRLNGKWHFLKRPQKEFVSHPLYVAAFEKEFQIGYTLEHSNIVRYISKGKDGDGIYLLTEYIDGITLKEFIHQNPIYFKKTANRKKFLMQILSALEYLHSRQILHLDLKPENILITHINKDVKLIDLGFAYSDCHQFQSSGKTKEYAAPEQLSDGEIGERTDIYAFGLILLYVFSGTTDFNKLSTLPPQYKVLARKCLQKNPTERFPNITEIKERFNKKQNSAIIVGVLLFMLLICGYFVITRNTMDNSLMNDTHIKDSIVSLAQTDTVNINEGFISYEVKKTENINKPPIKVVFSEKERLANSISAKVKSLFTPLYSTYKEINDGNSSIAQQMYETAVNASLGLSNSFTSSSISSQEINTMIRKELDKETAHYISMTTAYMNESARKHNEKRDHDFIYYQNRMAEIFAPIDSLLQTEPDDGRRFMSQYKEIYRECLKTIEGDSVCNEHFKSGFNPFSTYTREFLKNYQNKARRIYNENSP